MLFDVLADAVQTTVAAYTLGSGSLTVASAWLPVPGPSAPILVTVVTAGTYGTYPETFATYQATGLAGTTLTGLTLIDGVDTAWVSGDIVEMRICAKHLNDLAGAVASGGTVTTVSVASANGLAGTVANPTIAPAITLRTTVTGILKGNGTALSAAVAGTDYAVPPIANAQLANNSITITAGSGLSGGGTVALGGSVTLTATGGGGTVQSVSVSSANGFQGGVANPTTFPAIILGTTVVGMIKGDGSQLLPATPGADYLVANQTITLSGDATGTGTTTIATTLATVNGNVGSFGSGAAIPNFTVDGKGRITAAGTSALGPTVRTFTAILGQGVPVATGTNAAGNFIVCSNAGTFTRWDMAAVTAPVGASLVVDVLKSSNQGSTWASLWGTNPGNRPTLATTINSGGGTSFDTTTFAAGDWLRFDIITVGSSTPGQNVTLELLGHMNQ